MGAVTVPPVGPSGDARVVEVKDGNHLRTARRLTGLVGIKADLNHVLDVVDLAYKVMRGDPETAGELPVEDLTALQALYTAALVTYARCFTAGARTRLEETHVRRAAGPSAESAVATHRVYMAARDKHLAHSVNAMEDGYVGLVLNGENPVGLFDVKPVVFTHNFSADGFLVIGRLAKNLLDLVNTMIQESLEAVRAEARALTSKDLEALPVSQYIPPQSIHAEQPRSVLREIPKPGAWGYASEARLGERVVHSGSDEADRPRHIMTVRGPEEPAVFRRVGNWETAPRQPAETEDQKDQG